MPLPQSVVVVVEVVVLVLIVVVEVLVVVVVVLGHPLGPQASQQLGLAPMVAGGLQRVASRRMLQWIFPTESVRQQVTKPGLPQVERAAQRTTLDLQGRGSRNASTSPLATPATHRTYWPWLVAAAQGHWISALSRVAQTAAMSVHVASARAGNPPIAASKQAVTMPRTLDLMQIPPLPAGGLLGRSPGLAGSETTPCHKPAVKSRQFMSPEAEIRRTTTTVVNATRQWRRRVRGFPVS